MRRIPLQHSCCALVRFIQHGGKRGCSWEGGALRLQHPSSHAPPPQLSFPVITNPPWRQQRPSPTARRSITHSTRMRYVLGGMHAYPRSPAQQSSPFGPPPPVKEFLQTLVQPQQRSTVCVGQRTVETSSRLPRRKRNGPARYAHRTTTENSGSWSSVAVSCSDSLFYERRRGLLNDGLCRSAGLRPMMICVIWFPFSGTGPDPNVGTKCGPRTRTARSAVRFGSPHRHHGQRTDQRGG